MMVAIALMTGVIATAQENKSCQEKCCKEQSCQEKCCKEQSCKEKCCKEKCCKEKCCKEKPCKEQCCESKGKCKDKAEMVRCQTQRMVEKYGLNEEQAARRMRNMPASFRSPACAARVCVPAPANMALARKVVLEWALARKAVPEWVLVRKAASSRKRANVRR